MAVAVLADCNQILSGVGVGVLLAHTLGLVDEAHVGDVKGPGDSRQQH